MDPSKSWFIVGLDLTIKLISASSVLVLGIVGIMWQRSNVAQTERRRSAEAEEQHRRQQLAMEEQRFLPMFDSLASLEMLLDQVVTGAPADARFYRDVADTLSWRNMSLYIPADADILVRLPAAISLANRHNYSGTNRPPDALVEMPLRSAVGLTADFIRGGIVCRERIYQDRRVEGVNWRVLDNGQVLLTGDGPGIMRPPRPSDIPPPGPGQFDPWLPQPSTTIQIDGEFLRDWEHWLPPPIDGSPFFIDISWESIARELLLSLRREIARIERETLMNHPTLAEKYLAIRTNVIVNKTYRISLLGGRDQPQSGAASMPTTSQQEESSEAGIPHGKR